MKKIIKIISSCAFYQQGNEYLINDEDLEFEFEYEQPKGVDLYLIADNGVEKIKRLIKNKSIILDKDFVIPCRLKMEIEITAKGKILKRVNVEDLFIKEFNSEVEGIPQLCDMEDKLNKTMDKVDAIENRLNFFIELWKEGV